MRIPKVHAVAHSMSANLLSPVGSQSRSRGIYRILDHERRFGSAAITLSQVYTTWRLMVAPNDFAVPNEEMSLAS